MRTLGFLIFMIVFILALSNIATYVSRSNGIPDVFARLFPEKFVDKEAQKALETGMAPFAEAENAAQPVELHPDIEYDPLGQNVNVSESLDLAHRHEAAVSEWVTESVSEVLNFTVQDYDAHKVKLAHVMNQNAVSEFDNFMEVSQVLGLMRTKNYELKTFVMDIPQMRTSGVVDGRYRWVYDVPVNMTFLPVGSKSYEGLAEDQYQFETLTFRVQIGRVETPAECKKLELQKLRGVCHGMIIETWEVLKKPKPESEE